MAKVAVTSSPESGKKRPEKSVKTVAVTVAGSISQAVKGKALIGASIAGLAAIGAALGDGHIDAVDTGIIISAIVAGYAGIYTVPFKK